MNTYPDAIEATKQEIDDYIKNELGQKGSEMSSIWINSEFEKQKDFARESGFDFSDEIIKDIVVSMGKRSADIQFQDAIKYKKELDITRPQDSSDFIPPFSNPISKQGVYVSTKRKQTNLPFKQGFNVDSFISAEGAKPFTERSDDDDLIRTTRF
tara:strand:+ start:6640 stop:7104 length:465 start_codon:yes stop_codon:yes gene_type:complete